MMQSKPQQDVSSDGPFVEKLSRTCRDSEPLSYRVQRYRLGLDATPLGLGVTHRRFERFCCGWETSPHKGSHWIRLAVLRVWSSACVNCRLATLRQGIGQSTRLAGLCTSGQPPLRYFFTSGHSLASSGLAASAGGMVAMVL